MVAEVIQLTESKKQIQTLNRLFDAQRQAFRQNMTPSLEERKDNLKRLKQALLSHKKQLIEAINEDFGSRSPDETLLAEMMPSVQGINYALKNLKSWMSPSKRHVSLLFFPAKNEVQYQPLGVVGIIVPWNYPLYLAIGPLTCALAAGNRVLIKMSEYTPKTAETLKAVLAEVFQEDLVAVVTGDADVAVEFSRKPFDHLLFTGSTAVGKHVMRAAADNLTPVTLELGGKSPAIISADVPMKDAAERLCFGKSFNAGQTCVAPDYVLCPRDRVDQFVEQFRSSFASFYPTLKHNRDFTSIIDERQHKRLKSYLDDARKKGARIIEVNPAKEDMSEGTNKMPLYLVLNANDSMKVLQEEIFGPILPIIPYNSLQEALDYINDRPRPLALYYFGYNKREQEYVLTHTRSGGVSINDTLMHVAQDDMPFGGVGHSGTGRYHGREGFETFSCVKGVHIKQRMNSGSLVFAPHGTLLHKLVYSVFIR